MWSDSPLRSRDASHSLDMHHEHFKALVEIGIISPIGYGDDGEPRFSKKLIDKLSSEKVRLREIIDDNFKKRRRPREDRWGEPWEPPTAHYPYDSPGQAAWARRRHELGARLWRGHDARREVNAVKRVNERSARKAYSADLHFDPSLRVFAATHLTREQLYDLVWARIMDEVATLVGMTETPLRQLCVDSFIPIPTRGHFNFLDPIDRPPDTPLPMFPKPRLK